MEEQQYSGSRGSGKESAPAWSLDPELRQILVCPACKGDLQDRHRGLACLPCGLLYPVVDGIPWMIEEEAESLTP